MNGRVAGLAIIAVVAALLTACVPGAPEGTTPPSPTETSAAPEPTPAETGMPAFETIDGTWCPADGENGCLEIALPYLGDPGAEPTSTLAAATVSAESAPCYSTFSTDIESGIGEVALFYCPRGVAVEAGVIAELDDTAFDRLYLTQNPPYVDVYFREEDLDAALAP